MALYYLSAPNFSTGYRIITILGGFVWILLGLGLNSILLQNFGVFRADDVWHDDMAMQLAQHMSRGNWQFVASYFKPGNPAFHLWVGFLYFLTGIGKASAEGLNALFGFWGTLALTRHLGNTLPMSTRVPYRVLLVTLLPSAIFWASLLLKEALMFWSMCIFFTSMLPSEFGKNFRFSFLGLIGALVGMTLRPYTMITWVVSISVVTLYRSRLVLLSAIMVAGLIFSASIFGRQIEQKVDVESSGSAGGTDMLGFAEGWSEKTQQLKFGDGSTIEGRQIFLVSGAISLFFRPFLWNFGSLRMAITSLEIWIISFLIIFGWLRTSPTQRRLMWARPDVPVCVLVCMAFSVLFTFLPNEGIVARSRLQAMPALLTLAYLPLLLRHSRRAERTRMRSLYAQQAQYQQLTGNAMQRNSVAMSNRVSPATRELTK